MRGRGAAASSALRRDELAYRLVGRAVLEPHHEARLERISKIIGLFEQSG